MDATGLAATLLDPIPANATLGITVVRAVDGEGVVATTVRDHATNVIGSLHSSGLIALIDAACLAAVVSAAPAAADVAGLVPLGAAADLRFLAPAHGELRARCTLGADARKALAPVFAGSAAKARVATEADVLDGDGDIVCRGGFTWSVRRAGV